MDRSGGELCGTVASETATSRARSVPIVRAAASRSRRSALARRLAPLALCLATLGACGGDNDDDDDVATVGGDDFGAPGEMPETEGDPPIDDSPPDPNARPGLVVRGLDGRAAEDVRVRWFVNTQLFRNDSFPESSEARVRLLEYRGQQVSSLLDFYAKELDTCELTREDTGGGGGGNPPPRVGGGATVTIGSQAGPWLVLDRMLSEDGTQVTYGGPLPGPLPNGATLSIPGDVFPSVAAYPLDAEPPVPVGLLPGAGEPIDARGVFSWVPVNGDDFVELVFAAFDANGDFIDFPLSCDVVDDGRFELPPEAVAFIESTDDVLRLEYERTREVLELSGGIVFRTRTTVRE